MEEKQKLLQEKGILQPKNDVVFKALFTKGKESITKAFIEDILKIKIKTLDLDKSKDLINDNKEDKNGRLDLRAVLNDNIECDIELQLKPHAKQIERFLYYWAKLYASNLKVGHEYAKLRKTISIIIVGEDIGFLKDLKRAHTKWQIREEKSKEVILTNYLELHIIELSKALREYRNNPKDEVLQWMMFLDNPEDMEVQKIMEDNKNIKNAKSELNEISADEALRWLAIDRIMIEADKKQYEIDAKEKGMRERKKRAAEK